MQTQLGAKSFFFGEPQHIHFPREGAAEKTSDISVLDGLQ